MPDKSEILEDIPAELTVTLRKPVPMPSGETLSELRLREPTAGETEEAEKLDGRASIYLLISRIAGVPVQTIKQIGVGDINRAEAYLMRFILSGREIGGTS